MYLDEFVFRFNRRRSGNRGLLFWRLICALAEAPETLNRSSMYATTPTQERADKAHEVLLEEDTKRRKLETAKARRQTKQDAAGIEDV